jgi:hypothetical protein
MPTGATGGARNPIGTFSEAVTLNDGTTVNSFAQEILLQKAIERGIAANKSELVVRSLLPVEDLKFTTEAPGVSLATATAYNTVVNVTNPNNKIIAFIGATYTGATPKTDPTTLVGFIRGSGGYIDIWTTYLVSGLQNPIGYTSSPVFMLNNDTFKVNYYNSGAASSASSLALIGLVVEPIGTVLSPNSG